MTLRQALLALLLTIGGAHGHVYMKLPASRNFIANSNYEPQASQASGSSIAAGVGPFIDEGCQLLADTLTP